MRQSICLPDTAGDVHAVQSGVFSYDLEQVSADTAFSAVKIQGNEPASRAFSHLLVLSSEQLLLYGGVHTAVNDSGVGLKRVGHQDAWTFKCVSLGAALRRGEGREARGEGRDSSRARESCERRLPARQAPRRGMRC